MAFLSLTKQQTILIFSFATKRAEEIERLRGLNKIFQLKRLWKFEINCKLILTNNFDFTYKLIN